MCIITKLNINEFFINIIDSIPEKTKGPDYGLRKKICGNCNKKNHVALRKCNCGTLFEKKRKSPEDLMPKKKSNVTAQSDK